MTEPRKSRSGPSGPTIPDSQRKRPKRPVTMSPEAWSRADDLAESRGVAVSRLLEALVLAAKA